MANLKYPLTIKPLSEEEGGGYQVEYLDLPGCMADGETVEEALKEGEDAVLAWIRSAKEDIVLILKDFMGAPGRIRTADLSLRRGPRYPLCHRSKNSSVATRKWQRRPDLYFLAAA